MLFSATQTKKIEDLAKLALSKEPIYVGVDDDDQRATVEGLQQVSVTSSVVRATELLTIIVFLGICRLPVRQAVPVTVHVFEEESK